MGVCFGHSSVVLDLDDEYLDSMAPAIVGHDQVHLGHLVRGRCKQGSICFDQAHHVLARFDGADREDKVHADRDAADLTISRYNSKGRAVALEAEEEITPDSLPTEIRSGAAQPSEIELVE